VARHRLHVEADGLEALGGVEALGLGGEGYTSFTIASPTGEGLTTAFRELKPGTVDAIFDGLAPLRWCMFAEPANLYRGKAVTLEAVLANEDALLAGDYPVDLAVFGANGNRVFERKLKFSVPNPHGQSEPALALPVISEQIIADWPTGKYRCVCTFEKGAAAAGGEAEFYVVDPTEMPRIEAEVVLWGEDADLLKWLTEHNISVRQFADSPPKTRELILIGSKPAALGGTAAFREIAHRIERGSTAIFLEPKVFAANGQPVNLSLLGKTGTLISLPNNVYHKDDWSKVHPIFDGLPTGGLLDNTFYRELIPNVGWSRPDAPTVAVAGSIYAFTAYSSALLISVDELGAGWLILNTLAIRENLAKNPAAERLLRNLLRWAAPDTSKPLVEQTLK